MPKAATPHDTATLRFDRANLTVGPDAVDIRDGLSAVVLHESQLWLACDEGCRIERLTQVDDRTTFESHATFPLDRLLTLPAAPTEEADVEGMDVDDGYLWLVGSHSIKRKRARDDDAPRDVQKKLGMTARDGNRHLLARIPIAGEGLRRRHGSRRAAALAATPTSSILLDAIASPRRRGAPDPHLAPFVALPGKDNGFDIEGLAVSGNRAFIGLRGPVLREWACILECELAADDDRLELRPTADGGLYRKHFLRLDGLGIRDLVILEDDIWILAGPTMTHDGPTQIWRWKNGTRSNGDGAAPQLRHRITLPQRSACDKAEGFTLYDRGSKPSVLVVFDTPAETRKRGKSAVRADVYRLK